MANDQIQITVADNGCGIAATISERIFEPFFTTKDVGAGTGLGLAIVFGIVKDHGGVIEAESRAGEGSCFRIRLPITRGANRRETPQPVASESTVN